MPRYIYLAAFEVPPERGGLTFHYYFLGECENEEDAYEKGDPLFLIERDKIDGRFRNDVIIDIDDPDKIVSGWPSNDTSSPIAPTINTTKKIPSLRLVDKGFDQT